MASLRGTESDTSRQVGGVWEEYNKIVVGIDIGTTQSAVSLTYLAKGAQQEIHRISKWPGQGEQDQGAKIPTVIWYNLETKKAELFGAEALSRDGRDTAEDRGWFLAKHFKLHLQPKDLQKDNIKLDPLPPGVSLNRIYSDFLGYLLKHTKAFVEKRMAHGKEVWEKYKPTMEVVIAHPNGWSTSEQAFLREAAIDSGFVDLNKASKQVQFVTEAEASIHYCVHHSSLSNKLQPGTNLVVCDAGGSTVDTTLYSIVSNSPVLQLREARISDTVQVGGVFVNMEFEAFMRKALKNLGLSPTQVDDLTAAGIEDFENFAKRTFAGLDGPPNGSEYTSIRVANASFSQNSTNQIKIHRGHLKVPSPTINRCFDVTVKPILSSVGEQLKNQTVQHVLLVGGYGDSPYLHKQFTSHFKTNSREVVFANDSTSKAVADGSVIWNTLCSVVSRTPRHSFGIVCAIPYFPWSKIPGAKKREAYIGPQGIPMIPGKWTQIVKKGVPVDADTNFQGDYRHVTMETDPPSILLRMELFSYSGNDEPTWAWDKRENLGPKFKEVCTITAQLYDAGGALKKETGFTGIDYWYLDVNVCICFGTTELQAHLEWEQNGVTRKGSATVVAGRPVDL
ncbi:heat shock 70 kDa protein 12A [Rhizoctonia solani AG-3 Rhs1AP]|uniref:Heat shock 70 kDa protein 12A n=2 Tax=Rhizoctonia solani AG-3 TaxID=1086053 RepID=A0A074RPN7_9AGAM|nr:heat shock 70 kDa protein 12A [Rhizoctonia solani AG-3 Rhs1AP]KEP48819.1 heat shock 70 kDa protein 12A [Rhizoctonia solani 123E]